jgi:hypothetical protein
MSATQAAELSGLVLNPPSTPFSFNIPIFKITTTDASTVVAGSFQIPSDGILCLGGSIVGSVANGTDWATFVDFTGAMLALRSGGVNSVPVYLPSMSNVGPTSGGWVTGLVATLTGFDFTVQGAFGVTVDWTLAFAGNYSAP